MSDAPEQPPQPPDEQHYGALKKELKRQQQQIDKAQRERSLWLTATRYLGVVGLLVSLPVVGGAYLGRWLDSLVAGYSVRWTISLMLLGLVFGAVSAYVHLKD